MDLTERGAGRRCGVERLERLAEPSADLGRDRCLDLLERDRLDIVLQPRQRAEVHGWQEVGAGRQELTELDERRPHRFELVCEPTRVVVRCGVVGRGIVRVEVVQTIGATVLEQQCADLLVAGEVADFQRQSHRYLRPLYPTLRLFNRERRPASISGQRKRRRRRLLETTKMLERPIDAPAIRGFSSPAAANGIAAML